MDKEPVLAAITVPDLGVPQESLTVSVWLVPLGARLARGDRVVEISTGEAVVDLPAPVPGVLAKKLSLEDDPVTPGQVLGWIRPESATADE